MKRFLKIISMVLAIVMVTGALPAMADDGKVEISFSVGDSVLTINGENVEVEKPYVVGDGVTLVPVRVITEAFGAKVGWVPETKTINLSYPDVEIVLQIGNLIADVNGKAENLLAVPELSKNGFTMVPLRFISENFGADVGWDNATKRITVTKQALSGEQSIIGSSTDAARIGDSYYGWSMDNSADMSLTDRSFDESEMEFSFNDKNTVDVTVLLVEEDYDFEKSYNEYKSMLKDFTLVAAEKDDSNPKLKCMHFQAKDKEVFIDCWEYATEDYIYALFGWFDNTDAETVKKGTELLKTFKCDFAANDTYDLSSVKDGYRKYKSETMKFELDIPADYYVEDDSLDNEVSFMSSESDNMLAINVAIYSKSAVTGAKELAEKDYELNKDNINPQYAKFCDGVYETVHEGFSGYEYTFEMRYNKQLQLTKDSFFELGDYVYNIRVDADLASDTADKDIDRVLNSFRAETLDSSLIGTLMRNDSDSEGKYVAKGTGWSMRIPNSYVESTSSDVGIAAVNMGRAASVIVACESTRGYTFAELRKEFIEELETKARKDPACEVVNSTKIVTINNIQYADCLISQTTEEGDKMYTRCLMGMKGGKVVTFVFTYAELTRTDSLIREIDEMVKSFTFN